ncbi:hypothetical protein ABKN59_009441 [Abortiporus biennis]
MEDTVVLIVSAGKTQRPSSDSNYLTNVGKYETHRSHIRSPRAYCHRYFQSSRVDIRIQCVLVLDFAFHPSLLDSLIGSSPFQSDQPHGFLSSPLGLYCSFPQPNLAATKRSTSTTQHTLGTSLIDVSKYASSLLL